MPSLRISVESLGRLGKIGAGERGRALCRDSDGAACGRGK